MAVFVEHFPPYLGSDRTIFELATRAAKRGVHVHFIATQPLRYLLGKRPKDWKYAENWSRPAPKIHQNISVDYLLVSPRLKALWRRFPPLAFLFTLVLFTVYSLRAIVRFQPQVIAAAHASPIVGIVSFLIAKITVRPLVMGCPDWMTAYAASLSGASLSSMGPVIMQFLENFFYRFSDRIIAATQFLKDLLERYGIDDAKITVIPNGVDIELFRPDLDAIDIRRKYRLGDSCVVLFTGHLEEWAGVSFIYDLVVRLGQDYPESVVLLVGSGEETTDIFARLVTKNLGHMLIHAGLQPFEEMPKFNAAADIALCLFPDTPVSHAASPLKLFEYMGAGKAVVATKVSGTEEVLDDSTGILVKPGATEAICDAVVELCKNDDHREKLGTAARQLVEREYSWDVLSKQFVEECTKVIRVY